MAGFLTSGMQLDSNTQTAITGLSVSAGGTVAFVQGSGVLNIYSLEVLHRDGQELRHRWGSMLPMTHCLIASTFCAALVHMEFLSLIHAHI